MYEVLNHDQYPAEHFGRLLNFSSHEDAMRQLPLFMERLWQLACPHCSACGFKVLQQQIKPPGTLLQLFQAVSPIPRAILLQRRDVHAQHASLVKARSTGFWGFPATTAAIRQGVCEASDIACQKRVARMHVFDWAPGRNSTPDFGAFMRERERWHTRVQSAAAVSGVPLLVLQTEMLNGSSALASTMGIVRDFLGLAGA